MSQKKWKDIGSLKIEPLKGKFFDIGPSPSGKKSPKSRRRQIYFNFILIALLGFLALNLMNTYRVGRQLVFEKQAVAFTAYEKLKNGIDRMMDKDGVRAAQFFSEAEKDFISLQNSTRLLTFPSGPMLGQGFYLDTAQKLIVSAIEVSQMGQKMAGLLQGLSELPQAVMSVVSGSEGTLLPLLKQKHATLKVTLALAVSLQKKITTLNEGILPNNIREKLAQAQSQTARLITLLKQVDADFKVVFRLLGDEMPQKYLVLLQNNHELRATGGFIGSYLLVDVNDGRITNLQSKDIYESDGQLSEWVPTPPGIDRVAKQLYMRDANYSPDFPTSAQQIMWFLEHSKGASVDGVIAIDQVVVERLLRLTGPVPLPGTTFKVTTDNFSDLISYHTEAKINDEVSPKQLLFNLIPVFQKRLGKVEDIKTLAQLGLQLIDEGHVQVYFPDENAEKLISKMGLDGRMVRPDEKTDYLSVITTSIGGNKSDKYIHTEIRHHSFIGSKEVDDWVAIKKTHAFSDSDRRSIQKLIDRYGLGKLTKETLLFILGQGANMDYMRVYVPLGSMLKEVKGIDQSEVQVSEGLGYTVFAFIHGPIMAGASKEISLHYELPLPLDDRYRFIAEHQAGAERQTLIKQVTLAEGLEITESYPDAEGGAPMNKIDVSFAKNQIYAATIAAKSE